MSPSSTRANSTACRPGQIYSIYYRDEHNFGTVASPQTISIPVDYGELLVLHVEDETSTVLITGSKREFFRRNASQDTIGHALNSFQIDDPL